MESMYGCIHYESVSHLSCHVPESFVTNMRLLSTLAATEEGRQLATCSSHDLGCSSWSDLLQLSDLRMPETCFIFRDARNLWNMQLHAWLTLLMVHVGSCRCIINISWNISNCTGCVFFPISSRCFSSRFCWLGIPYNLAFDDVCRPSQEGCSMATCTVVTGPVERQPFPRKCHCLHFSVLFGKAEQKVFERGVYSVNRKAVVWGVWIISHNKKIRLLLNLAFWLGLEYPTCTLCCSILISTGAFVWFWVNVAGHMSCSMVSGIYIKI